MKWGATNRVTSTEQFAPQRVTYKVHSNTIPEMREELDLLEWENGENPVQTITEFFRYWYGPSVKVKVSLTHNTVQVEYE